MFAVKVLDQGLKCLMVKSIVQSVSCGKITINTKVHHQADGVRDQKVTQISLVSNRHQPKFHSDVDTIYLASPDIRIDLFSLHQTRN